MSILQMILAGCPPLQSWGCVYLKLLGRERQHHPEQMRLEIHFGGTRNKKFFFPFLFIFFFSPVLTLCLPLSLYPSPLTRCTFLVLANESACSQRYMFFSIQCVCEWQWWLFVFSSFVTANKFEIEKERELWRFRTWGNGEKEKMQEEEKSWRSPIPCAGTRLELDIR